MVPRISQLCSSSSGVITLDHLDIHNNIDEKRNPFVWPKPTQPANDDVPGLDHDEVEQLRADIKSEMMAAAAGDSDNEEFFDTVEAATEEEDDNSSSGSTMVPASAPSDTSR